MAEEGLPVQVATRALGASVSGFYAWRSRAPSARAIRHVILTDVICEVHAAPAGSAAFAAITPSRLGRGLTAWRGTVAMLMQRACLKGIGGRPKWRRAHPDLISAYLVDRQLCREGLDQLWVTDITERHTRGGKVYGAVVLDVCSRRVVGWSIDSSPAALLVTNAAGMAIDSRRQERSFTLITECSSVRGRSPPSE